MDLAYAHVHRWMTLPFVWGESDCMMVIADYLNAALGLDHDCGAIWRGKYDSALSCQRLTNYINDPTAPARAVVEPLGLDRTEAPKRGDVGVVAIRDGRAIKNVGALHLGRNWAAKAESGVMVETPINVLAAWSVPCAS